MIYCFFIDDDTIVMNVWLIVCVFVFWGDDNTVMNVSGVGNV